MKIGVFKPAINQKVLTKKCDIKELDKNRYLALDRDGISHREEFTEGVITPTGQLPYLMRRSSYYFAFYHRHLYSLKAIRKAESTVLDLGSGHGLVGELVHRATYTKGTRYIAVDARRSNLQATDRIVGGNVFLIQDHLTGKLDYIKTDSIDSVIAMEIIEHMTKRQAMKLLREMYRVSKAGARIIISTPNTRHDHEKQYEFHPHEYSIKELRRMMEKAGFSKIKLHGWVVMKDTPKQFKQKLPRDLMMAFDKLSEFHSPAMLKQLFSPAVPSLASSVLFDCVKE